MTQPTDDVFAGVVNESNDPSDPPTSAIAADTMYQPDTPLLVYDVELRYDRSQFVIDCDDERIQVAAKEKPSDATAVIKSYAVSGYIALPHDGALVALHYGAKKQKTFDANAEGLQAALDWLCEVDKTYRTVARAAAHLNEL